MALLVLLLFFLAYFITYSLLCQGVFENNAKCLIMTDLNSCYFKIDLRCSLYLLHVCINVCVTIGVIKVSDWNNLVTFDLIKVLDCRINLIHFVSEILYSRG